MRRLVALLPSPLGTSPGRRVRIEAWAPHLERWGWTVELLPFADEPLHEVLHQHGRLPQKAARFAGCYRRQLRRILDLPPAEVVFVHREAAVAGPAVLERLARRGAGQPRLVLDLDDPAFVPYRSPTSGWLSLLKFPGTTRSLVRMADQVIAINERIAGYAARYNPAVTAIPAFVDTDIWSPSPSRAGEGPVRLVSIGSHTTTGNLATVVPALVRLQRERDAVLRVVAGDPVGLPGVAAEWRRWSAATEVEDVRACDIGLVPVADLPWNRWKFFYKTIQYMAVGLPVVARRMGSNTEVISDGVDGFLVETQEEWYHRLRTLIDDPDLRRRMGAAARTTVVERYSALVQLPRVRATFEAAVAVAGGQDRRNQSTVRCRPSANPTAGS